MLTSYSANSAVNSIDPKARTSEINNQLASLRKRTNKCEKQKEQIEQLVSAEKKWKETRDIREKPSIQLDFYNCALGDDDFKNVAKICIDFMKANPELNVSTIDITDDESKFKLTDKSKDLLVDLIKNLNPCEDGFISGDISVEMSDSAIKEVKDAIVSKGFSSGTAMISLYNKGNLVNAHAAYPIGSPME